MGEYLTRYIITAPMPDQTAETVARTFVNNVVLIHGVPEKVLTDQGTNFKSELMNILYKQYGITRLKTTAYRPQCDGMVERVNRTLADIIASYVSKEPTKWSDFLPSATFAYNTAVHSSTGYTPFYLMYGREATEPQDMIQPARNRNMTNVNMIFSQMWYDALDITKEKLKEAKEKTKGLLRQKHEESRI
jgi:transposase InsO family protein